MTDDKASPQVRPFAGLDFQPRFDHGHMAQLAAVYGGEDGTVPGRGFCRMDGAEIPWTVRHDEIPLVLEGSITMAADGKPLAAGPRDRIWPPSGTPLIHKAEKALIFYTIHPASWADAETRRSDDRPR